MSRRFKPEKRNPIKLTIKITIVIIFLLIAVGMKIVIPDNYYRVTSESMLPLLKIGDYIEIDKKADVYTKEISEGDIIVYDGNVFEKGSDPIVHRIIKKNTNNFTIITKGDNNQGNDPNPVPYKSVIRKV